MPDNTPEVSVEPTQRSNSIYLIEKASPSVTWPEREAITEEEVEAALSGYVPGGARVYCWLPMADGHTIHQTARDVMRSALAAAAKFRLASQTPPATQPIATVGEERDELEIISGDDDLPYSFSSDGDEDGMVITQHRYYRWGDTVIALGELNYPNRWDDDAFDAKCRELEEALATLHTPPPVATATVVDAGAAMTADKLKAVIRAWLDADDATHWGAFETALDAAVSETSERAAVVAMLRADAATMRANADAYSEEAPTDAKALHEVAATLTFKAAQIERGDHFTATPTPTAGER